MLQDRLRLVLLDALGHHVEDVVHDGGAELEVEVRLDALLGDRLGDALGVPALELTGEQVAEPALEQRDDAAQEEEPDAPARRPEADTGALADGVGVEARVDDCDVSAAQTRRRRTVLEVLGHPDLPHELVLVAVHARQLADVRKGELQPVGELEGVDVAEPVLDVRVDDELGQAQNLAAEMERVAEARLLALLGRQRLDRLEVHVVVEVQVLSRQPRRRAGARTFKFLRWMSRLSML